MQSPLDAVVIPSASAHKTSVIWLHGLGADGHDFEPIVPELKLPADHGIQFIFPHAPYRAITINGGLTMRAWYDVKDPNLTKCEDVEGITDSSRILTEFIDAERGRGIAANKILLAGFSQGGAIALHTALRFPYRLAGVLALSTYLPMASQLREEVHPANSGIPIFMAHGKADPVIPLFQGLRSFEQLKKMNYMIEWHVYPMLHAVCPQELAEISSWLQHQLTQ
ncbi:MAG: alpha/beta hydrolase [Gammaproteobacteria bacterium]|nr:alpha/beta hydrolase [Gammaproteobacteria bacterium]MCI0591711.1 alpha/beta hydrolase [Gammaproteobacteria bacterium]